MGTRILAIYLYRNLHSQYFPLILRICPLVWKSGRKMNTVFAFCLSLLIATALGKGKLTVSARFVAFIKPIISSQK